MPDETKNIHDIMYLTNFILDSLLPFRDGSHKISSRKFHAHGQIGCNYCITLFAETTSLISALWPLRCTENEMILLITE